MKLINDIKKSKTVQKESLVMILGLLSIAIDNFALFKTSLSPTAYGIMFILLSMFGYYLRTITTEPLDKK